MRVIDAAAERFVGHAMRGEREDAWLAFLQAVVHGAATPEHRASLACWVREELALTRCATQDDELQAEHGSSDPVTTEDRTASLGATARSAPVREVAR